MSEDNGTPARADKPTPFLLNKQEGHLWGWRDSQRAEKGRLRRLAARTEKARQL